MIKIKDILKSCINSFLKLIGLRIISNKFYDQSINNKELVRHLQVLPHIKKLENVNEYIKNIPF